MNDDPATMDSDRGRRGSDGTRGSGGTRRWSPGGLRLRPSRLGPPEQVKREAVRRLGWISITTLLISVIFFLVYKLVAAPASMAALLPVAFVVIAASSAFTFYAARFSGWPATVVLKIGLLYYFAGAWSLAFQANRQPWPDEIILLGWSPVAVWTMLIPMLLQAPARFVVVVATLASAADPLTVLILSRLGTIPLPPGDLMVQRFVPNVIAVIVATAAAHIVTRLEHKVTEARELGSYVLDERLGEGGMGEVWRARHRSLARPAAVKLIKPEALGAEAGTALRRFRREAKATARLQSPHTIAVYDFGDTADGSFYYVMELLDGLDLRQLVEKHGPLPPARAVHLLRQACHSLAEAHAAGLVHRDVKPANLYACRHGLDLDFLKVLDFGLVRQDGAVEADATQLTRAGTVTGTPATMAPEMVLGGEVDGRTDLYALGCVAYWLLTGTAVFDADTPMGVLVAHAKEEPVPPGARTELAIPADLEAVVMRCLAKAPADRFADAEALDAALAATACAAGWTRTRARDWWDTHLPA